MPIYFQKIESNFDPDGAFLVKDSRGCNLATGGLFLVVFLLTALIDRFGMEDLSIYHLLYLTIVPAVYLIKRGLANKTIMTINRKGFYYFGELVTSWDNFIDAVVRQDEENRTLPYDITDRFMLFIRYGKIGHDGYFGRKFLMTATMDKSEEEIMAAIKFYYQNREPGAIVPVNAERPPAQKRLPGTPDGGITS